MKLPPAQVADAACRERMFPFLMRAFARHHPDDRLDQRPGWSDVYADDGHVAATDAGRRGERH